MEGSGKGACRGQAFNIHILKTLMFERSKNQC